MNKKTYWKDVRQSFSNSKGRVVSIASLMALGSFALVGLKVTSPNMQVTGEHFLAQNQAADLTVIGDYGLASADQLLLQQVSNQATVEYGYLKDVEIKNTTDAVRIFSKPESISQYAVVEGTLPMKRGEIALTAAYQNRYTIGDTFEVTEKENANGELVLKEHQYTIVGFVNSSEILSRVNLGQSTAGSGELKGYAVVTEDTFDSQVYMIARLRYHDLASLNPFKKDYLDRVYQEKTELQQLFLDEPARRVQEIKETAQSKIDDGQQKIEDAIRELADAQAKLFDGQSQIDEGEAKLSDAKTEVAEGQERLSDASQQLTTGKQQLDENRQRLNQAQGQLADGSHELAANKQLLDSALSQLQVGNQQLQDAKKQLDAGQAELNSKAQQLADGRQQLQTKYQEYTAGKSQLQEKTAELVVKTEQLNQLSDELRAKRTQLEQAEAQLEQVKDQLDAATLQAKQQELANSRQQLEQAEAQLAQGREQLKAGQAQIDEKQSQLDAAQAQLAAAEQQLALASNQLTQGEHQLQQKQAEYQAGLTTYQAKVDEYDQGFAKYLAANRLLTDKQAEYQDGVQKLQEATDTYAEKFAEYQAGIAKIDEAQATIRTKEQELADAKVTLREKQQEYDDAKAKADPEIADKKKELQEAQEKVNELAKPTYNIYTRREIPGSEGYVSYENNASIISNVGNIFPVALYFIASLVTFVTMARFVDEERIKAGTFKALGYDDKQILRKFTIYGLVTSMVGTTVGVIAGHLLLPSIVYSTYGDKLVLAPLEYHFYPGMTLLAVAIGLLSAVLPAFLAARKELSEKPAQLLLPKPPAAGSKILLERLTPLWNKMSFTQKVTARNIFRYKQRMLMTIFGVCGSISLLFAGLGIRDSIADLNNRQFVDIIKYDIIVANHEHTSNSEQQAIEDLLASSPIKDSMALHYETVTKVAGAKNDEQSITTLVFDKASINELRDYMELKNRQTGEELSLTQNGVIISEKMANLANVKVGDTLTVYDSNRQEIQLPITGITEMYMSHFVIMNEETYEQSFGKVATSNAHMVLLNDQSNANTEKMAAQFMELAGVKGVVQNTTLKTQVETIVNSLNRVMGVMIGASVMLAIVVLYNLTNINVSERIRELSTIKVLGFYNKEVTLYIYRETIYLSLIGILVGFALGLGLHAYMVAIIPPDMVMFNPAVGWIIYAVPSVVVVAILGALGFIVNHWLKRVDMLEALKSVE